MGRLLKTALLALVVLLTIAKGPAMAQNLGHSYGAGIYTERMAWSLEINNIFVRENTNIPFDSSAGSITTAVHPGKNTLSLLFSPLTGKDPETDEYVYELNDGVKIDISLDRYDYTTRERQEIGLLRIRYDTARQEFVSEPGRGGDHPLREGPLSSDGRFRISELDGPEIVFRSGQMFGGYRLDIDFNLEDDRLPPPIWAGKAVPLSDTPELRRELLQAYERIHHTISNGDIEAIFQQAEPIWAQSAFLLTDYSTAREFIENTELGLAMFQAVDPNGGVLQPLTFVTDIQDASLQFMADNQLVRVRPDPIRWKNPPGSDFQYSTFPVVFYKSLNGAWHIGDINVGY